MKMPHPIIVNYFVIEIKPRSFKNVTKHMNKNEEEKASDRKKTRHAPFKTLEIFEFLTVHISKSNYIHQTKTKKRKKKKKLLHTKTK